MDVVRLWQLLLHQCVVERPFVWLDHNRRLVKADEFHPLASEP